MDGGSVEALGYIGPLIPRGRNRRMYTTSKPGLGRLPWVLASIAASIALALGAISQCPARHEKDTVVLKVSKSLPGWEPGPGWASAVPPERRPGEAIRIPIYPPWTEQSGEALFAPSRIELIDPFVGKMYKPSQSFPVEFQEHPDHHIQFVINSRSMREDDEPRAEKPALRVLVAGDSHTDGVCKNTESFANLTEAALRIRAQNESRKSGKTFDPSSIEVLNAGKGSHSFYNYLGVLERYLDLQPDVFVVTIYGGNDFDEALTVWHYYNNQGRRPAGAGKYEDQLQAAVAINVAAPSQALGSIKYFAEYPEQKAIAVQAGTEVFGHIQDLCRERGIRLIVLYLPGRPDVEPQNPDLNLRKLLRALELQPEALASTNEMGDQLIASLSKLKIEAIDLRPAFKEAKRSLYWNSDWHINLTGHHVVADHLIRALSARK
ncbi:MAG TPA: SGNH/GDSL hydrolase family protein [Planctomycetota bacterium]|nr:SGNH/GDSL hydrolase family protein [Planctomycetota bacterium]